MSKKATTKAKIQSIYDTALERLGGNFRPLHYGPAHIIWDDYNYSRTDFCLTEAKSNPLDFWYNISQEQMDVVVWSLEELAKIPYSHRQRCEP